MDDENKHICYTLELPWKNNLHDVSCIPPTLDKDENRLNPVYECEKYNSTDHPDTWQLINVANRTKILIHNGCFLKDTHGCILVGLIRVRAAVLDSVAALNYLRNTLPDNFILEIIATPMLP